MRLPFTLFFILAITSSCTNQVRQTLGIANAAPDEHKVSRNKSLEIPPYFKPSPSQRKVVCDELKIVPKTISEEQMSIPRS